MSEEKRQPREFFPSDFTTGRSKAPTVKIKMRRGVAVTGFTDLALGDVIETLAPEGLGLCAQGFAELVDDTAVAKTKPPEPPPSVPHKRIRKLASVCIAGFPEATVGDFIWVTEGLANQLVHFGQAEFAPEPTGLRKILGL